MYLLYPVLPSILGNIILLYINQISQNCMPPTSLCVHPWPIYKPPHCQCSLVPAQPIAPSQMALAMRPCGSISQCSASKWVWGGIAVVTLAAAPPKGMLTLALVIVLSEWPRHDGKSPLWFGGFLPGKIPKWKQPLLVQCHDKGRDLCIKGGRNELGAASHSDLKYQSHWTVATR